MKPCLPTGIPVPTCSAPPRTRAAYLPSILVPAPAPACLRYEPEIALRDPHSLAVCGHYLHSLGIVTMLVRALLEAGASPDPQRPPEMATYTARPNWGTYPVIFP